MEESIGEEKASEGGEKEIAPTPAPAKKHSVAGLIRHMWPAYLIEVIVIILGISITLALEEWRDHQKENRLEQIYLRNLITDINTDLQSLEYAVGGTQTIIERGNDLIEIARRSKSAGQLADTGPLNGKVSADVRAILGRPKFYPSDATFSDLKSSGNLHLINDIQLKNTLFAYYSQAQNIKEMQDAEQQATIVLSGNYFLKRFPLETADSVIYRQSGKENPYHFVTDFEFNNNVQLRVLTRKELMEDYKRADSIGLRLKSELEKKIE